MGGPLACLVRGALLRRVTLLSRTRAEVYSGVPIGLRSLFFSVDICTWRSDIRTSQALEGVLFENAAAPGQPTIEGFYRVCSYGKVSFKRDNAAFLGPLRVACTGAVLAGPRPPPLSPPRRASPPPPPGHEQPAAPAATDANYVSVNLERMAANQSRNFLTFNGIPVPPTIFISYRVMDRYTAEAAQTDKTTKTATKTATPAYFP
eukprot:XP_001692334.1 matrix metalloproteinase-like protein [Chlamydomonas reinhardtii]